MTYTGITLALSKGRIFDETLPLLAAAGIAPSESPESSRKLIIDTHHADSGCQFHGSHAGGRMDWGIAGIRAHLFRAWTFES